MTKNLSDQSQRREASDPSTSPERLSELAKSNLALTRLVAANEGTPGSLLAELSEHADRAVRRRVVRNPATPAEVAARAGSEFPDDLLDNPAFDLYMIEQPDLLTEFGEATLRALLKRDRCPTSFFSYAAEMGDPATALALLSNAAVPQEVVNKLRYQDLGYWASKSSVLEACHLHHTNGASGIDWRSSLAGAVAAARLNSSTWVRPPLAALARLAYASGDPGADLISPITEGSDLRIPDLQRAAFATPEGRAGRAMGREGITSGFLRQLVETVDDCSAVELLGNPDVAPLWTVATLAAALRCLSPPSSVDPQQWEHGSRSWNEQLRYGDWDHLPANLLAGLPLPEFAIAVAFGLEQLPILPAQIEPYLAHDRTRRAIAAHRGASPEILERLIQFEPWTVAGNPAASAELLRQLTETAPEAVAGNPSAPPDVLRKLVAGSASVQSELATNPATPADILNQLGPGPFGLKLAGRPDASSELLAILAHSSDVAVRRLVAGHPNNDGQTLAMLAADSDLGKQEKHRYEDLPPVRAIVAANPLTPPNVLALLAGDSDLGWTHFDHRGRTDGGRRPVREVVAANPAIGAVDLERLIRSADLGTWQNLLWNPAVTDAQLLTWAQDPAAYRDEAGQCTILEMLLDRSGDLPDNLLGALAAHGSWPVLKWASNYSTPEHRRQLVHNAFAQNPDEWKRSSVANERSCASDLLEKLAGDASSRVREAVAKNGSTGEDVLAKLANDAEGDVRAAVASNLQTPTATLAAILDAEAARVREETDGAWRRQWDMRKVNSALAQNRHTPLVALESLAMSKDLAVLTTLAKRATVPTDVKVRALTTLAMGGEGKEGREAVFFAARHRNTPRAILEEMLRSPDLEISRRARANKALGWRRPNPAAMAVRTRPLDAERIERALDSADPATELAALRTEWLDDIARPNQPSLSRLIAFHQPDCPPSRLAKAQRSNWWPERCAIASHPKTPLSAVRRLADDGNVVVRAAARDELARREMEARA